MSDSAFGTFFLPGPTEVRRPILDAMTGPMLGHRSAEFEALYRRCQVGLKAVFRTERPVYVLAASATAMMEAGLRAVPRGKVLCLVNGAFSARFREIATDTGHEPDVLEAAWGETVPLEAVEAALRATRYAAVTVVHSETTTGVLSDIAALAQLARSHGTRLLVDSVTGIGGAVVETDAWGLDYVLTGSQKALALPPGLAFACAEDSFIAAARAVPMRGRYLDLCDLDAWARKDQTPATPAISLMYALAAQLESIMQEGIAARWARHEAMRVATERWVERLVAEGAGIGILAKPGQRAPTVTVLTLPAGVNGPALVRDVAARGYVIGSGYGKLKDTTIRIGHMGDHDAEGLAGCLAATGEALRAALRGR